MSSLSLRLALWVGFLGLVQALAVMVFAYVTFEHELASQSRTRLRDKVEQARRLVAELADDDAVQRDAFKLVELVTGQAELHMAIARQGSSVPAVAFSRESEESLSRLIGDTWAPDAFLEWRASGTKAPMLSLSTAVDLKNGHPYDIVVSVDRSDNERLLHSLLVTALTAAPVGLAMVVAGALVFRSLGLRPLRRIQEAATLISANNLAARIDPQGLPDELIGVCSAFNAMLERLDEGIKRLSDFSSDLAHEMRTPLATLLGRTQVALSQHRTADEMVDVLEGNVEEIQRLNRLVSDMLFLAQADHAAAALDLVELDLRIEAVKVAEFLEPLSDERGVSVSIEGEASVNGDRNQAQRAITNLLSNALRNTTKGSVVLVQVSVSPGEALVDVINDGDPIPAQHQSRLFDRFYRADDARGRDMGGTGLGLSIVKTIMQLHGGSVELRSDTFGRNQFRLRFPSGPPGRRALVVTE